jgi:hypothetical protein
VGMRDIRPFRVDKKVSTLGACGFFATMPPNAEAQSKFTTDATENESSYQEESGTVRVHIDIGKRTNLNFATEIKLKKIETVDSIIAEHADKFMDINVTDAASHDREAQ